MYKVKISNAMISQDRSINICDIEISRNICYLLATSEKNGGFIIVQRDSNLHNKVKPIFEKIPIIFLFFASVIKYNDPIKCYFNHLLKVYQFLKLCGVDAKQELTNLQLSNESRFNLPHMAFSIKIMSKSSKRIILPTFSRVWQIPDRKNNHSLAICPDSIESGISDISISCPTVGNQSLCLFSVGAVWRYLQKRR